MILFHNDNYSIPLVVSILKTTVLLLARKCHLVCVEAGLLNRVIKKTIKSYHYDSSPPSKSKALRIFIRYTQQLKSSYHGPRRPRGSKEASKTAAQAAMGTLPTFLRTH